MSSDSEPEVQTFLDAKIKAKELLKGVRLPKPKNNHNKKEEKENKIIRGDDKTTIKPPNAGLKVSYMDEKIKNLMDEELPVTKTKLIGVKLNTLRSKRIKKDTKVVLLEKPLQKAKKIISDNMQVVLSLPKKISYANQNPKLLEFKNSTLKTGDPRRMPLKKILKK
jgi:hypothetical protein